MRKHCMKAPVSAGTLEVGKYKHFIQAYLFNVEEWDYTQFMYTIDGCNWWQQWMLPAMPSHKRKLYNPGQFWQWPIPRYTYYECGTGWWGGCWISSGVDIRRNWGTSLGGGWNWLMEFWNSGLEESYQLDVTFLCFSLLFSSSYLGTSLDLAPV